MKTKQLALDALKRCQLALDALKRCFDEFSQEHDGTDFESECTECWTANQAREAVAALEADIAQPVKPVAYCVSYDGKTPYSSMCTELDNVTHACQIVGGSAVVMPLYTHPPLTQHLKTDGIVGWRWIATCGSGAYQLRDDEPMRGYSYKAPVYEDPNSATPPEPAVNSGFTGMSDEVDFSTDRWTFLMDPGYRVSAGQYLITKITKATS